VRDVLRGPAVLVFTVEEASCPEKSVIFKTNYTASHPKSTFNCCEIWGWRRFKSCRIWCLFD